MKQENKIIRILIGIPASGKTTWALEYVRKHPNYVRVNRDDMRLMLKNAQVCENKIENMITDITFKIIEASLMKRMNVIVDNTNLKKKYIDEIVERFKYSADIEFQVFDISLNKAIERDSKRENKVGEGVIRNMYENYKILCDSFNFQTIPMLHNEDHIKPDFNSELPDAVLFDIDGTLALMGRRGPFDWKKVYVDDVNDVVAEQVKFHMDLGRKIILVSGRDSICRDETIDWLGFNAIHFDELYMRPEGDMRKDTIIKKEIYENHIEGKYNVICVYDDRLQVLDMWNKLRIFAFNVNQGNKNF